MGSRVLAIVCASGCGFHPGVAVDSADSPLDDASLRADGAAIDGKLAVDPALVQQKSNSATSGSPLSVTLAAPPTAGNVLLMIGAANSGGLTSVTGGGVATWTLVTSSLSYANIEIWFGVTNGSSSTITIAKPSNPYSIWLTVSEWSGLATSNVVDGSSAMAGTNGTARAGSLTTVKARDLVVLAVADDSSGVIGAPTPGAWTACGTVTAGGDVQDQWYRVLPTPGAVAPTVADSGQRWDAAIVALKVAP